MRLPAPSARPNLAGRTWPAWLSGGDDSNPEDELQNWSSLIGIITAICGNVLIALALNVQRYAHIRLHRKKMLIRERARQAMKNAGRYGAAGTPNGDGPQNGNHDIPYSDNTPRGSSETDPLAQSFRSDDSADDDDEATPKAASTYLKDPYWWVGQVLITVGEMGNFLAYGFAPASIVSPLGVVALVSNCVIAPIFFKETFRQRDFWGVIIAILGAVTVVLSAKTEETKLGPHEVWDAITTMEFEIYLGVTCALIALLMWLSPRYGNKTILIDLGLVGLFGGYTALSTKGVSSMLSSTLLGAFTTPVTYVLVFVLLFTAIMQVRYLNKALQRFESTQVIPVQFVLFTLCVIVGSAVLYRDFERTTSEQAIKFVGGCLFTFFGVFVITSGRPRQDDDDEATLSDAEGIEETIGLAQQDRAAPPTPQSRHTHTPARSRGSSRTSRASFPGQGYPPSRAGGAASQNLPPYVDDSDDDEDYYDHADAPLLSNPWQQSPPTRPSPGLHTLSSDSIPPAAISDSAVPSATTTPTIITPTTTKPLPSLPLPPIPAPANGPTNTNTNTHISTSTSTTPPASRRPSVLPPHPERPHTPRAPASASRLPTLSSHHVYSPSPFSGTLSAVVGDKLRGHLEGQGQGSGSGSGSGGGGYSYSYSSSPGGGVGGVNSVGSVSGSRRRAGGAGGGFGSGSGSGLRGGELFVALPGEELRQGQGRERGSVSAGGPGVGSSDGGNNGNGGFRGRARSLSNTLGLGGWFGGGNGGGSGTGTPRRATVTRRDTDGGSGGNSGGGREGGPFGGLLERARTAGDG